MSAAKYPWTWAGLREDTLLLVERRPEARELALEIAGSIFIMSPDHEVLHDLLEEELGVHVARLVYPVRNWDLFPYPSNADEYWVKQLLKLLLSPRSPE